MKKIVILASGSGTNADKLIQHFADVDSASVVEVLCNVKGTGVFKVAEKHGVPCRFLSKETLYNSDSVSQSLLSNGVDLIVLAGFLLKIPAHLIQAFPDRILNIHPALLPAFGGKGMYGMNVHRAVVAANATETGITVHVVNEVYDDGRIIFQASCDIEANDSPEIVAKKVLALEHLHFPQVVENFLRDEG